VQDRRAPLDVFVGRAAELAQVSEVVSRVAAGQPWLVTIEGDPGVGKTALARRCLTWVSGLRVLSARAGQAETDLDFGLVDQLLRAAGGAARPELPADETGSAASSFAVGAHLLEVLGEQQARAAVVVLLVDDLQWADRRSVEALTFMLRRLSVDPVLAVLVYRGPRDRLDETAQRLLVSVEHRLHIPLGGLSPDEVASLAAALTEAPLDGDAVQRLYRGTGGHPLYLRTVLSDGFRLDPRAQGRLPLPRSLAAAVGDHLRVLPAVLLTTEQGFSAAAIHSRHYELPMLHLAAGCVPAGRGAAEEAERHARLAGEAAASLDYGQENLYAAMARALVGQASGDYLGMADALGYWRDDATLDDRSRTYTMLWRPLLAEGLIGSGQAEQAAAVVDRLRAENGQIGYLQPALAWLDGWLAEQRGDPEEALRIYQRGEEGAAAGSPVHAARLWLAHGRLLRRTGNRKDAVQRLRRASGVYQGLRATPFLARAEEELAACRLPGDPARKQQPVLALTSRETEVAHLVGKGLSNPEIAAELFISRKAVEYHLGNIYAKSGLTGRQELRRFVGQWHQPAAV
jgi:DNA-binding CsgD family transcriptional regulator